jgi:(1->4)-alpha-D-glucan 1-alpha-D-glucosylmutase
MARLASAPRNMLATSSHDTKRGEDARMRIVTISSHTGLWQQKLEEWIALLGEAAAAVDPNEVYFFFQLLVGVWPDTAPDLPAFEARVTDAMLKSVREAGANTRWVFGDDAYEDAVRRLVKTALALPRFNASFTDFLQRIGPDATHASLIQTALKLTVPGVPDIYQGAEMWDRSLVDPDNRRPVDFAARAALLAQLGDGPVFEKGRAGDTLKLALIRSLLQLRRAEPALFAQGDYCPLEAVGPAAKGFLGFTRRAGSERLLVAAALHPGSYDDGAWAQTRINLPATEGEAWFNLIDASSLDPREAQGLFAHLPLAILRPQ